MLWARPEKKKKSQTFPMLTTSVLFFMLPDYLKKKIIALFGWYPQHTPSLPVGDPASGHYCQHNPKGDLVSGEDIEGHGGRGALPPAVSGGGGTTHTPPSGQFSSFGLSLA